MGVLKLYYITYEKDVWKYLNIFGIIYELEI